MRDIIIQGLSIAIVSSFFIGMGLRILLAKRPVIEGQWWQALTLFVSLTATAGLLMTLSPGYLGQRWLLAFLVVGGLTMIWGTILWSLRRGNVIVIGSWLTYERLSLESRIRAAREAHYETVP